MKTKILIISIVLLLTFGTSVYYFSNQTRSYQELNNYNIDSNLKSYSVEDLKAYDGSNQSLPILIGMNGLVYDVSNGSSFYAKGKTYNYLVGKDSSEQLNLIGGKIIKEKYPVVGKLQ